MPDNRSRNALLALLLLVPVPSIGVWVALYGAEGHPLAKAFFALCKVWLLVLPILWHVRVDKQSVKFPRPSSKGMGAAVITGIAIFILEFGGRPIKAGESFSAAFLVGYFDTIAEMHAAHNRYKGHTALSADKSGWRLVK